MLSARLQQKIISALLIFFVTMGVGVIGYLVISPQSTFLDALYMTVITLATVGYGEIVDLSHNPAGRIFTIILIMFGMGNILYVATTITEFFTDGELQELIRRRKMEKLISKLKDHIILCGAGIIGRKIIEELTKTETPFVLVTLDHHEIHDLGLFYKDLLFIEGDPSTETTLISAGIQSAKGLIATLSDDRDNLFVVVTAKKLNSALRVVCNATNPENSEKYRSVGVDSIISPNLIGGLRMVSEMLRPSVVTFLDVMLRGNANNTRFSEVTILGGSPLIGRTIGEAKIRDKTGLLVISIKNQNEEAFVYNPMPSQIIHENAVLIVIGTVEEVARLKVLADVE
ncbi:MAG: NAD-binding protein [Candidatus Margulisiibacteriota bacterium]